MMNGVSKSKVLFIRQLIGQGKSIFEISDEIKISLTYVRKIRSCIKNRIPTDFYQKKFKSLHPEKKKKERKENYDKGATHNHFSHKFYSLSDGKLILEFGGTDRELAKLIGRSVRAIQIKRSRIRK